MSPAPLSLWVIPVGDFGGVARHVLDVARTGIPGYRLTVLCPEGPLAERLRAAGAPVLTGSFGPDAGPVTSARTLRKAVRTLRPAIVHTHLAYADIIAAGVLTLDRSITLISTEHGIAADASVYHHTALRARVTEAVHHARLRRVDEVIAVSASTRDVMQERWSPTSPATVIPNGVDLDAIHATVAGRQPRTVGEGIRLLSLSRLAPEKRIDIVLRSMPEVLKLDARATLTIAGTGPLDQDLKELASELGVAGAVRFPGFVHAWSAMRDHDVVVQLSAWENLSYTLLDAAAAGLDVIATNVGGNGEIIHPALLLDDPTPQAVIERLRTLNQPFALPEPAASLTTVDDMVQSIAEVYGRATTSRES